MMKAIPLVLLALVVVGCEVPDPEQPWQAARGPGGINPDLNGVWQALNEANWDIERHRSRASLQLRDGPLGPVPAVPTLRMGAVAVGAAGSRRRRRRQAPLQAGGARRRATPTGRAGANSTRK